jgi:phage/plasmid-like protein (TIGR03299 family)
MGHDIEMVGDQGQMTYEVTHGDPWHLRDTKAIGLNLVGLDFADQVQAIVDACPTQGSTYSKIAAMVPDGRKIPGAFAVQRDYDNKLLPGTVGPQQSLRQPTEIFERLGDMVSCIPGATISASGFLRDGARMWVCVKVSDSDPAGEKHTNYLTFFTGFDGSLSTHLILSKVRAVCRNTVSAAIYDAKGSGLLAKVKNTKGAKKRLDKAQLRFAEVLEVFEDMDRRIERMSKTEITDKEAVEAIFKSFGVKSGDPNEAKTRTVNKARDVWKLFKGHGKGSAGWESSVWGLHNALTEYADHHSVVRGVRTADKSPTSEEDRQKVLDSLWLGSIAKFKAQADEIIDELLERDEEKKVITLEAAGLDTLV